MTPLHWLTVLETLTLGAALVGVVVAGVTGQVAYGLGPIVLCLILNQWNRRQADSRNRQGAILALRRARQELIEEIQTLRQTLQQHSGGALSQLKSAQDLELAIAQIQRQNARLDTTLQQIIQALNQVLPTPMELSDQGANGIADHGVADNNADETIEPDLSAQSPWQEALRWQRGASLAAHDGWVNAMALRGNAWGNTRSCNSPGHTNQTDTKQTGTKQTGTKQTDDRQQLVTGGNDRQLRCWHIPTGEALVNWTSASPISALAFSPDGQTLASGSYDHRIQVWQVANQSLLTTLEGHQDQIKTLVFMTNPQTLDRCLISGSYDQSLHIWDLSTGEWENLAGHQGRVQSLALDPQDWRLASGSETGTIHLWQLPDGELIKTLDLGSNASVETLGWSGDGQYLAAGASDGSLQVWNLRVQECCYELEAHTGPMTALAITPDNQTLISGGADGRLKLWHLATGRALGNLAEPVAAILSLVLSADGDLLISCHPGGKVQMWHRSAGE
jgi:hypothetical protein